MVAPTTIPTSPAVTAPVIGRESSLSNWAGPYVTNMLGRGQALAESPFQAYQGPLTAGPSELQNDAFSGLAGLAVPSGTLDTPGMGGFDPTSFNDPGVAGAYMNPFIGASLDPQLREARRQAEVTRVGNAGRLTDAGAFGGSRQAIMEAEGDRNLGFNLSDITGEGYNTAFSQARDQFNTEQDRSMTAQGLTNDYGLDVGKYGLDAGEQGLANLAMQMRGGDTQRGIESEGIAADRAQFMEERDDPFKRVQFQQSLLDGMPLEAQSTTYQQPNALWQALNSGGGLLQLLQDLFPGGDDEGDTDEGDTVTPPPATTPPPPATTPVTT